MGIKVEWRIKGLTAGHGNPRRQRKRREDATAAVEAKLRTKGPWEPRNSEVLAWAGNGGLDWPVRTESWTGPFPLR